jgi:hypothetical protein
MKKIVFSITLITSLFIILSACKKEVINDQEFVKNHFIGKWPLKVSIKITTKNGDTTVNEKIIYGLDTPVVTVPTPRIDTVSFTADGKYTKKGDTVNYSIDATGDNISYSTTPPSTWKIEFLRNRSIILTQRRTEKIGADNFNYYIEEQLIK